MSLPVAEMYGLVEDVRERLQQYPVNVVGYGHLGDSNIHLNVSTGEFRLCNVWPLCRVWSCEQCTCLPTRFMIDIVSSS